MIRGSLLGSGHRSRHTHGREIVRAIAAAMSDDVEITDEATGNSTWSPWDTWPPFFLDTTAAADVGYRPVGDYANAVQPVVYELTALSAERQEALARNSPKTLPRG